MDTLPVYCLSGLGADQRVFEHLVLPGCTLIPVPWLDALPHESIGHYAERMAAGIPGGRCVVMGLSFGGIMAVEIGKLLPGARLWLISTVKIRSELPFYMRFGKYLPLHKPFLYLNPHHWMGAIENYNLSVENEEERRMVADYRNSVSNRYLRWALNAIVNWENVEPPFNAFQVHGGSDRIFPARRVHADVVVPGAGHFLVHNRAAVVSRLLLEDGAKSLHLSLPNQ
jgi:hypothetical protein